MSCLGISIGPLGTNHSVSTNMQSVPLHYSITEMEICGLAIYIARFVYLLKRVDVNVIVDHLTLMHITMRKAELIARPQLE